MKAAKVEIVEDDENPAELCYEVNGVWMSAAEHDKLIAKRLRWLDIKEALITFPLMAGIVLLCVWLVKG